MVKLVAKKVMNDDEVTVFVSMRLYIPNNKRNDFALIPGVSGHNCGIFMR